jgi:RNA polymerase sigma factor (sigma-70 family)
VRVTAPEDGDLIACVDAALAGDARSLEVLLIALKDPLFRLALRTLGNFADAEDATQEILVKIMTALASFERRSSLRTWAFRIAINHLRDVAAQRQRTAAKSLDEVAAALEHGLAITTDLAGAGTSADPALELEAREVGLHCLQGILMCLDVDQRLALVLSDVFLLDARSAARILDIDGATYRQRLSRARRRHAAFLHGNCGLVNPAARCTCRRQARALRRRRGKALVLNFARGDDPNALRRLEDARVELSRLRRVALVLRDAPAWSAPEKILDDVRRVLSASPLFRAPGAGALDGWPQPPDDR